MWPEHPFGTEELEDSEVKSPNLSDEFPRRGSLNAICSGRGCRRPVLKSSAKYKIIGDGHTMYFCSEKCMESWKKMWEK
jgi:YHS domain-containing protein